jgi:hypothetical protein
MILKMAALKDMQSAVVDKVIYGIEIVNAILAWKGSLMTMPFFTCFDKLVHGTDTTSAG